MNAPVIVTAFIRPVSYSPATEEATVKVGAVVSSVYYPGEPASKQPEAKGVVGEAEADPEPIDPVAIDFVDPSVEVLRSKPAVPARFLPILYMDTG